MKERVRERFIGCLLAVILFFAGMCVEIPHADVSFLRAKEAYATDVRGGVISDGSRIVKMDQICTLGAFRQDITSILSCSRGRSIVKRVLRHVAALMTVVILLSYFLCLGKMAEAASVKLVRSHITIVRYIQQTDGKK